MKIGMLKKSVIFAHTVNSQFVSVVRNSTPVKNSVQSLSYVVSLPFSKRSQEFQKKWADLEFERESLAKEEMKYFTNKLKGGKENPVIEALMAAMKKEQSSRRSHLRMLTLFRTSIPVLAGAFAYSKLSGFKPLSKKASQS